MLSIITLPGTFLTDITANMTTILTDLGGYIALILGIVLGGLAIEILVGALRK